MIILKWFKRLLALIIVSVFILIGMNSGILTSIQNIILGNPQTSNDESKTPEIRKMAAIGTNLDSSQKRQTIQLLGAEDVDSSNILSVDGLVIHRYLNDGSDINTSVVSSAMIEPLKAGEGLRVEIVTPTNIELISKATFENAALTAGAKDMTIKIAAIRSVTGEGALAGVYAMLDYMGYQLEPEDIEVAEDEIQIVIWIKEEFNLNDDLSNRLIRELKLRISEFLTANSTITQEDILSLIIKLCDEYAINYDKHHLDRLVGFGIKYAGTNFAKQGDTVEVLNDNNFSQYDGQWINILPNLDMNWNHEKLLSLENPEEYRNEQDYHPIIPAMFDAYFDRIQQDSWMSLDALLGHTFVVEAMSPQFTTQEITALNRLRAYIYYHAAAVEAKRADIIGIDSPVTKVEEWTQMAWQHQLSLVNQPVEYDLKQRIANATGYGVEVYHYDPFENLNGSRHDAFGNLPLYGFNIKGIDDDYIIGSLSIVKAIDHATNKLYSINQYDSNAIENISDTYDFTSIYGVSVANNYQSPFEITQDNSEPAEANNSDDIENLLEVMVSGNLTPQVPESELKLLIDEMEGNVRYELESYGVDSVYSIPQRSFDKERVLGIKLNAKAKYALDSYLIELANELISQGYGEIPLYDIDGQNALESNYMFKYDLSLPWLEFIASVDAYTTVSIRELAAMRTLDLSDNARYHPVIQAMYQKVYDEMILNEIVNMDVISHTFIFENLVDNLSEEEHEVLNYLRLLGYYYHINTEGIHLGTFEDYQNFAEKDTIKGIWLEKARSLADIQASEPERYEAIQQIALVTGSAYETSSYLDVVYDSFDGVYAYSVIPSYIRHFSQMDSYQYNPLTKKMMYKSGPNESDSIEEVHSRFNFSDYYGVSFEKDVEDVPVDLTNEPESDDVLDTEQNVTQAIPEAIGDAHTGSVEWLPVDWHRTTPRMRPEIPDVTWLLMSHHAQSGKLLVEPIYLSEAIISGYADPNSDVSIEWLLNSPYHDDQSSYYHTVGTNDQGYFEFIIDREVNQILPSSILTVSNLGPSGGALTDIPMYGYIPTALEHPSGLLTLERYYREVGDIEGYTYPYAEVSIAYLDGYAGSIETVTADSEGYFYWKKGATRRDNSYTTVAIVTHPETGEEISVVPYPWTPSELDNAVW